MGQQNSGLELRNAFRELLNKDVGADDHARWRPLFTATLNYIDFSVHVPPDAVREMRRSRPQNLAILLFKCVEQVQIFVGKNGAVDSSQSARNAIGMLGRVLPFVFECADPRNTHDNTVAAGPAGPESEAAEATKQATAVNPDGTPAFQPTAENQKPLPTSQFYERFVYHLFNDNLMCSHETPDAKFPIDVPLGQMLITSLVSASFIPGFTIGLEQTGGYDPIPGHPMVDSGLLWCSGVGSHPTAKIHWKEEQNINRRAVIIALVAALSGELYRKDALAIDPFHRALTDLRTTTTGVTFVCAVTNFAVGYIPSGTLPYTSHLITGAEDLALRCAQLLNLMGDTSCFYDQEEIKAKSSSSGSPKVDVKSSRENSLAKSEAAEKKAEEAPAAQAEKRENEGGDDEPKFVEEKEEVEENAAALEKSNDDKKEDLTSDADIAAAAHARGPRTPHSHPFWVFFSNLNAAECEQILRGLIRLAGNPTYAKSTYLPGSQRTMTYCDEYFILIWKLIDRCGNFLKVLCSNNKLLFNLIVPLLDYGLEARQNDGRFSPLQLMMFIFMRLSAITDFTIACNEPFNVWIPFDVPHFQGTYADLIILSMHTLLVCKHKWVQHVHLSAAMVINNMSAYVTALSQVTCSKLSFLFEFTSNRNYLEASPNRAQIFYYIAEANANLVQYQFKASLHLVYALVRSEKVVKDAYYALDKGELAVPEQLRKKMHVGTLCCCIDAAKPFITAALKYDQHANVVDKLEKATLVGKLPVPHRIITHHFESREGTDAWLTQYLWSCVFMHAYQQLADGRQVQLFPMK